MATIPGVILSDQINLKGLVTPPWLDSPVAFKTHPEGELASSLIAGPRTDNTPITLSHFAKNGVIIQSFGGDFYNRVLVEPAAIDAGNVITEQNRPLQVFNGFFTPVTIDNIQYLNAEGVLLNIPTPYILAPLGTALGTLTVSTEGPPDIDAQLKFEFDTYPDIIVGVVGSRVIALPYQPETPFKETLEWWTEVLTSNNGTEQRIQMRFKPRQKFDGMYHVPADQVARADNIVYGWLGQRWAVPVWSEAQLVENLNLTNLIPVETGFTDVRVGGLIMIWGGPMLYEVAEVESIDVAGITTVRPVQNGYGRAMVMPVRSGLGGAAIAIQKNGHTAKVQMSSEVLDNIELVTDVPAQFLGEDIYFENSLKGDDGFTDSYETRVDRVDFGATIETWLPWLYKKSSRSVRFLNENLEQLWTFRKWLHRRKGKLKPYWLPTFEANLRLRMTGVVSSSLIIEADDYKGLGDPHNHVAVEFADGTWRARTILGSSVANDGTAAVALDTPLNTDAANIRRISYLTLRRLDVDTVEISHIGNSVSMADIRIREIQP